MSVPYLEIVPQEYFCVYEDSSDAVSCTPTEFCEDPTVVSYEPNMELSTSYYNFVQKYDLACASKTKMGMIAGSFYIGFVCTLLFLPRYSDAHGRRDLVTYG